MPVLALQGSQGGSEQVCLGGPLGLEAGRYKSQDLGLPSLAEGAVGRHSGTLGEGTEGALPGPAASPVETCRSQPGKEDRGHSRENPYIMPLAS